MITEFLINMIAGVISAVFSILPSWSIDSSTVTQMNGWGVIGGSVNGYVPENTLLLCLALVVLVRLFMFAWDGVLFLYHLIPFNG